jgi:hypothetical protein
MFSMYGVNTIYLYNQWQRNRSQDNRWKNISNSKEEIFILGKGEYLMKDERDLFYILEHSQQPYVSVGHKLSHELISSLFIVFSNYICNNPFW